jgi:DNA mismatch repair protein MutS
MQLIRTEVRGRSPERESLPGQGPLPMPFPSILFHRVEDRLAAESSEPAEFFVDLNLDQIVETITAKWAEYNLKPFFCFLLNDADAIAYRQVVFQDLEDVALLEHVQAFAQRMRAMREYLAQVDKLYYEAQKEAWFLDAVEIYCDAIQRLVEDLRDAALKSQGFLRLRAYVQDYAGSPRFTSLVQEVQKLKGDLASIEYCVLILDTGFTVREFEEEPDYSLQVLETFQKFQQGAAKDYRVKFLSHPNMNHIEAKILEFVGLLYPSIFAQLSDFWRRSRGYLDAGVAAFDREVHFYVAYLEHMSALKGPSLNFCYPRVTSGSKEVYACDAFDLALAHKLMGDNSPIVCNDLHLRDRERIFVVTGPNQGGKTTFARTFGQLHYLAKLGCPVPGKTAQLFLFDWLFTHFEREESMQTLRGKLQDDLVRIHKILREATPRSVIIMNEVFTSTTLQDAVFLSRKVIQPIVDLDVLCVWVTFVDELASLGEQTVSMVSGVVPDNPTLRTFKILRRPADGLSYATSIAERYRVTYRDLKERLRS